MANIHNPASILGEDSASGNAEAVKITDGAIHTVRSLDSFSATRTTTDVPIGATGAAGDYLHRVLVTSVVGAADLTVSDGAGVIVAIFPSASAAGTFVDVGVTAATGGFVVDSHATAVGTVTCIGRFT